MITKSQNNYEQMMNKAMDCQHAAVRCIKAGKRDMAAIWAGKAEKLEDQARDLEAEAFADDIDMAVLE